jgi:GNAT superfamily N-acetyltransferase
MSTSTIPVKTVTANANTAAGSLPASVIASDGDGCLYSLNEAYATAGLIVATAAAERAQERAQAGTNGPVRHATPEDTAVIDTMLRAMGRESPIYRTMPIDDRKLADYIGKVIRSSDHAVLLHESAAGIDGVYIGMLVQQFFTFETTAMDVLFYVRPERRGSRAAVRLFRAFKAWARSSGAKSIQVGTMTGIDPARTSKFYRGMGLREIGGIYHGRAE